VVAVLNLQLNTLTGAITGTWNLADTSASFNDLMGTVTGQWTSSAGMAPAILHDAGGGGGGAFAGYTGTGTSTLSADADLNYTERGLFSVATPVAEPES
jgi:hypothetical protein